MNCPRCHKQPDFALIRTDVKMHWCEQTNGWLFLVDGQWRDSLTEEVIQHLVAG